MEEKKHFWTSKTFWGLFLIALGEVFEKNLGSFSDVLVVIGLILGLIGRWVAEQPLKI